MRADRTDSWRLVLNARGQRDVITARILVNATGAWSELFAETALRVSPGRPDVVLPELVHSEHVDCLILGTVCRTGFAAFWLGNTAEDVLPRLDCDVLLLRPQDYFDPR